LLCYLNVLRLPELASSQRLAKNVVDRQNRFLLLSIITGLIGY
ncbi:MAG: hypothetical protein EZS28_053536, partial [Streblomastix strix]